METEKQVSALFNQRPRHQAIGKLLGYFDADVLKECECYFGGGTLISMLLNEYRESVDADFICASAEGYRKLKNLVGQDLNGILKTKDVPHLREVRSDQYKIYTVVQVDGIAIKIEIVREARVAIERYQDINIDGHRIPCLTAEDLMLEKLLANTDRGLDKSVLSRDILDLGALIHRYGPIPDRTWQAATEAYGESVARLYFLAEAMIEDVAYAQKCFKEMRIDLSLLPTIQSTIRQQAARLGENDPEQVGERARRLQLVTDTQDLPSTPANVHTTCQAILKSLLRQQNVGQNTSESTQHLAELERQTLRLLLLHHPNFSPIEAVEALCETSPGLAHPQRAKSFRDRAEALSASVLNDEADEDWQDTQRPKP